MNILIENYPFIIIDIAFQICERIGRLSRHTIVPLLHGRQHGRWTVWEARLQRNGQLLRTFIREYIIPRLVHDHAVAAQAKKQRIRQASNQIHQRSTDHSSKLLRRPARSRCFGNKTN